MGQVQMRKKRDQSINLTAEFVLKGTHESWSRTNGVKGRYGEKRKSIGKGAKSLEGEGVNAQIYLRQRSRGLEIGRTQVLDGKAFGRQENEDGANC